MDECLNTINIWAISAYNISVYVRKSTNQDDVFGCVIDVMALIMDRDSSSLVRTLKYMLETYPCNHSQILFQSSDDVQSYEIAMTINDMIPFLCKIPGRECRYRLYRYAEPLLKYLNGDQFLIQTILQEKNNEDQMIFQKIKRKVEDTCERRNKIMRMREFELFIYDQTQFPDNYTPSEMYTKTIEAMREEFYKTEEETNDIEIVNELRKDAVESFMYIEEAKKLKKTDEITFLQVIQEMGYVDDFFKRIKCYDEGEYMKRSKGHKMISKKGKEQAYIYTRDDLDDMREIVKRVFERDSLI